MGTRAFTAIGRGVQRVRRDGDQGVGGNLRSGGVTDVRMQKQCQHFIKGGG